MKDNKQLTEQELDKVAGGVINPDSMCPAPRDRLGIIDPGFTVNPCRIIDPIYAPPPGNNTRPIWQRDK